jgi:hypothetical protein
MTVSPRSLPPVSEFTKDHTMTKTPKCTGKVRERSAVMRKLLLALVVVALVAGLNFSPATANTQPTAPKPTRSARARGVPVPVASITAGTPRARAGASPVVGASTSAYWYRPGDPMFFTWPGWRSTCTGGYVIVGDSGMFDLTDGHCAPVNATVSGTDRAFGTVAYSKWPTFDTELVREQPSDGAYQTVVDARTGRLPGGSGKVVGYLPDSALVNGYLVGKMGWTTGWTEGKIFQTISWHNMTAYCSHAKADGGDSGGPVWRTAPGGGVYAIGMTVAKFSGAGPQDSCFVTIDDILNHPRPWGRATLPVWSSGQASSTNVATASAQRSAVSSKTTDARLPRGDARRFVSAVGMSH